MNSNTIIDRSLHGATVFMFFFFKSAPDSSLVEMISNHEGYFALITALAARMELGV